jgi:Domain of unknown function (DUF4111)/Nucleotidyltransferase domain
VADALTPYPEVNALLCRLWDGVRPRLGPHFVGMYLYGSLAAGDFSPESSDVDFLVVTDDDLSGEQFESLREMHALIADAGGSKWATELEGSYIPRRALRRYDPRDARHPHIDRGRGGLNIEQHDVDWVVQRHVLHERGVVLAGPPVETLIAPVGPGELQRGVRELLRVWWVPMVSDPTRLRSPGYQRYAVLTMCRMLYTFRHGTVVSKPAAARWALATLDGRWQGLIRRAMARPREAPPEDLCETLDFIRYTSEVGAGAGAASTERGDR